MAYTTVNKSTDHFNTKLYTGNGSTNAITGVGFQPDFTWIKRRDGTYNHYAFDAPRGAGKYLKPNQTSAETDGSADHLTAWTSDGFNLGNTAGVNLDTATFASWNWKANGSGSSNTDGSITSTVSANTTNGFSIVKWVGTGANATIGHGLGAVPKIIIVKNLSSTTDWYVYTEMTGNTHSMILNTTSAKVGAYSDNWNDTTPTSSVFSVGSSSSTGGASGNDMIAYCFADVTGYSKFSSYTGNGDADGTFVPLSFRPAMVIIKRTDSTGNWNISDNKRLGYNPNNVRLVPNDTGTEDATDTPLDMLSNGFKLRATSQYVNYSGGSYIYLAFGQTMVGTNNVPATAR